MFYFQLKCITPCMRTFWHKVIYICMYFYLLLFVWVYTCISGWLYVSVCLVSTVHYLCARDGRNFHLLLCLTCLLSSSAGAGEGLLWEERCQGQSYIWTSSWGQGSCQTNQSIPGEFITVILFMVPLLIRAQGTYKDMRIIMLILSHTHTCLLYTSDAADER